MAIMSTYSSELISVSSISAYDVYKTYINPKATGKQLMKVNYISMTAFALFMGGFSTMLYYIGVGMGYLYLLMGVIISSGVAPAAATLIWKDQVCYGLDLVCFPMLTYLFLFQSWAAATFSPILGFCCSMASWLSTTYATAGEITIESTGANTPMLVGNVVALCSPLVFIPLLTYVPPFKPQKYDWVSMAVASQGEYGVPEGLISSFPVTTSGGDWSIVEGLEIDDFSRARIDASTAELAEERDAVVELGLI